MTKTTIDTIASVLGGIIGFLIGDVDGFFYALVAFVVLDYLSGVIVALKEKKLSSEVGFAGIAKKLYIFLMLIIANIVDTQVIGGESVLRTAVIFFYLANEGISILENAGNMGLPVPKKLMRALTQIKDNSESEGDENDD